MGSKKKKMAVGKRKKAVAKAFIEKGTGIVKINNVPLEVIKPEMVRLMIQEPLILAGDLAKKVNIDVKVSGGGVVGQAEAARQAIALSLVEFGGKKYKTIFEEYDRHLLVKDPRRTEPHKPSRSSAGPRRHKQRSKR
ncbi:MAG TPA: 30S ribosomal protein S9 [Candidatus Aenigmarchaeota archaeon]|nr:30S ribosomal protein S9 [Candidatus Aenigmarchaeota archaeon]